MNPNIENELSATAEQDMDEASDIASECLSLMRARNAKYGNSWKVLTIQSIANLIEMKMHRIANMNAQELDVKILDEFMDAINYAIFALMKLAKLLGRKISSKEHE